MGIDSIQEYLGMVASIVTSLTVLFGVVKWLYLDPREKLHNAEKKLEQKREERLIEKNEQRHQETIAKLEEATSQQTKLFQQYDERIVNLENQNKEHDGRILVLEKRNGIQTFGYVEKGDE